MSRKLTDEEKELINKLDFFTIEASPEEAGSMLAFIRSEFMVESAQHVTVPGQSRDLVTFGFPAEHYGDCAELSAEYQRPIWDGILVTRQPHRFLLPEEVIEFMEHGRITARDPATREATEDVDLDKDDDDTAPSLS